MRVFLLALLLGAPVASCADDAPSDAVAEAAPDRPFPVPYRLDAPDAVFSLDGDLQEISGLTMLPSGRLGAVQDEEGEIYEVDPATGAVVRTQPFADDGDYEGIELTPEAVWVLRSDGDLYRVARGPDGRAQTETIETALRGRNDTEGLAYDAAGHRLLIACKEDPGPGLKGVRAIWAFDLASRTLSERPAVLLDRDLVDGDAPFRPSGLAVHPRTGTLYVISSVHVALAVVAPDGALQAVIPLDPDLFPQPEGIAFAPDGTLYIASEGPSGPGTLLRFSPTDA